MVTVILRDVPPYVTVSSNSASPMASTARVSSVAVIAGYRLAVRRACKTCTSKVRPSVRRRLSEEQAKDVPEIALMTGSWVARPAALCDDACGDKPLRIAISAGEQSEDILGEGR